jgi:hypothetical protein
LPRETGGLLGAPCCEQSAAPQDGSHLLITPNSQGAQESSAQGEKMQPGQMRLTFTKSWSDVVLLTLRIFLDGHLNATLDDGKSCITECEKKKDQALLWNIFSSSQES